MIWRRLSNQAALARQAEKELTLILARSNPFGISGSSISFNEIIEQAATAVSAYYQTIEQAMCDEQDQLGSLASDLLLPDYVLEVVDAPHRS
ncbi:hypothetical protein [Bradyrhizobium neotropicale]|uniref:hypothetical protein n=1 Tax=Bradyrhizobium neotropicale TaxID=1497615 RepID=UPI001AD7C6D0|nr:hypothetical protein [Bradyrhizobium neotropicale]MBO4227983.1 hypothetical protein [Bradyrhizobium neotropicale]